MNGINLSDYIEGAALATNLVLTAPLHHSDRLDRVGSVEQLGAFAATHGLGGVLPRSRDVAAVAAIRTRLASLIDPRNDSERAGRAAQLLTETRAIGGIELSQDASEWVLVLNRDASIADRIAARGAVAILGVIRVLGNGRFRRCAREGCTGVFIDSSRGGQRAYCTPAICGNRVNIARHRLRQTAQGTRP